jgi:glucose-1-phosphate cytidylyltransferase
MKVVILAGGFGTRISEESYLKPKPMIEIGGHPILWHIMKMYSRYGFNEFVVCAGYKQHAIKEYFADYFLHCSDITFDFTQNGEMTIHNNVSEPWKVTVVDTGLNTMTGGRIKRIAKYLGGERFMLTYGDGVSDVPLDEVLRFHESHGKLGTITAVHPDGRFGVMDMDGDCIRSFREKNVEDVGWVNGGFMVLEPEVIDYIDGDSTVFEKAPIEALSAAGQLMAYKHSGFWQCMDTLRDKEKLENLWASGKAPWRVE